MFVQLSETDRPSESAEEQHQAVLKRLEEVKEMADAFGAQAAALEEKAEAALKAAGEAAEKLKEHDALASAVSEVQETLEKHSESIKAVEGGSEAKAVSGMLVSLPSRNPSPCTCVASAAWCLPRKSRG